jgi:murein L,D-transpeptidase YcbB/YkuD
VIGRWSKLLALTWLALALPATAQAQIPPALGANEAAALIQALQAAPAQGFATDAFPVAEAQRLLRSPDPALRPQGQAQLEAAAIAYARAQHGGRAPVGRFPDNWAIRPQAYDAGADFAAALAEGRVATWAAGLAPTDQRYGRLVKAYARYQQIAAEGGWPALPVRPALKPGATGEAVEALRRRLMIEDPAAAAPSAPPTPAPSTGAPAAPAPPVYDASLAAAVARAQDRYGLTPDGVAGPGTLAALNVSVDQRLAQIRTNLERWRWMPRDLPALRVELNIADASLALYEAGQPSLTMRVIVGRPKKQTPMFADHILAVVFNPPWNVPSDIAARETWPAIRRHPGYMARERFVVRPGGGLQQLPGPMCALGAIKFDLGNRFGVYLHDTPSRSLFTRDMRALSHGCMRLEKPNALAERLLAGDPAWPQAAIDAALQGGKTVRAPLLRPVPLYVAYWSVFVDDQGRVQFRPDVYHWDEKLLGLL